jgi:hypothetical protein
MPIAVNVDTSESDVSCLTADDLSKQFRDSNIMIARTEGELLDSIQQARPGLSFWRTLLIAGLAIFVIESLLAHFTSHRAPHLKSKSSPPKDKPTPATV